MSRFITHRCFPGVARRSCAQATATGGSLPVPSQRFGRPFRTGSPSDASRSTPAAIPRRSLAVSPRRPRVPPFCRQFFHGSRQSGGFGLSCLPCTPWLPAFCRELFGRLRRVRAIPDSYCTSLPNPNERLTMRCSELRALPFSYRAPAVVRPAQSRAVLPAMKPRHSPPAPRAAVLIAASPARSR